MRLRAALPTDFDWRYYIDTYPDLPAAGITSRERAIQHYINHGLHEGRSYRDPNATPLDTSRYDWNNHLSQLPVDQRSSNFNRRLASRSQKKEYPFQVAIVIHIGYPELIEEICAYLKHSYHHKGVHYHFGILAEHYHRSEPQLRTLMAEIAAERLFFHSIENYGMDIGGFFQLLPHLQGKYRYVLKIHTKRDPHWRGLLFRGLISSMHYFDLSLKFFENFPGAGMLIPAEYAYRIYDYIHETENRLLDLATDYHLKSIEADALFSAGTCFWIRGEVLDVIIAAKEMDRVRRETGYIIPGATYSHAWERFFGALVYSLGYYVGTV